MAVTTSSEILRGIALITPLPMGEGMGEGLVAFVTFHALPLRGGMGWGFYFFLHSIYPAPAIAKSKITIAM